MKIQLKGISLPKMMSDLTYKYHILVILTLSSLLITALALITVLVLSSRKPTVIAFDSSTQILDSVDNPKIDKEITQAIQKYISLRYNWGSQTVKDNIKKAENFISGKSLTAFQNNMSQVVRFSLEKDVTQRAYAENIKIDLKSQAAFITGDRITAIQGLKAAGNLNLALEFESGARTKNNPWGIYIVKETEGKQ